MHRPTSRLLASLTPASVSAWSVRPCCCSLSRPLRTSFLTVFSRSFADSASVRTSRLVPTGRGGDDTPLEVADAPPSALRIAASKAAAEQVKRDRRAHQQMPYVAYNHQLSLNVKELDSWVDILALLATELSNTSYNRQTADRYVHPNKKHTQLTHQTLHAITAQLIKHRSTRHKATQPQPHSPHQPPPPTHPAPGQPAHPMQTLARFLRILETAAPHMYEGKARGGRWRLLHQPYRYLRAVVEQWRRGAVGRAALQRRADETRAEGDDVRRRGGLTAEDMRRLVDEAKQRRKEQRAAEARGEGGSGGRGRDSLVRAMEGLTTEEEQRDLDSMGDEEKLRMQVRVMLEQQSEQVKKVHKQSTDEAVVAKEPRLRRDRKVPSFFSSPQ